MRSAKDIYLFYRNYQHVGVFCSLNIGVSGLVKDHESVEYLKNYE